MTAVAYVCGVYIHLYTHVHSIRVTAEIKRVRSVLGTRLLITPARCVVFYPKDNLNLDICFTSG